MTENLKSQNDTLQSRQSEHKGLTKNHDKARQSIDTLTIEHKEKEKQAQNVATEIGVLKDTLRQNQQESPLSMVGEITCSYSNGAIKIRYSAHIYEAELPRLVLGVSLKSNFHLVAQADLIYLLPMYTSECYQRDYGALNCTVDWQIPPSAFVKFGLYQAQAEQFFNIITI